MKRRHILLVDDDRGFLTALAKTLIKQGYAVTTAGDAADAAEVIRNQKPPFDLAITDLSMPLMSSLFLLSAIQTAFPAVKVIVITAFGDEETQAKAIRQGAFAFLHKPLDTEELFSLIERATKTEG